MDFSKRAMKVDPASDADHLFQQTQQACQHLLSQQFRASSPPSNQQATSSASAGGITTDSTTSAWYAHSAARRVNTDVVLASQLAQQYPELELIITPRATCDLLAFAASGKASFTLLDSGENTVEAANSSRQHGSEAHLSSALKPEAAREGVPSSHMYTMWLPPSKRMDGAQGILVSQLQFGRLLYKYKDDEFLVYIADTTYGGASWGTPMCYILSPDRRKAEDLVMACGHWSNDLHGEVWVYDQGYWQKNAELYESVAKASWDNVILDPNMKRTIIEDHMSFYASRDTYQRLKVPWKRGIIYYGPPGNGKTISVKAMMNMLYKLPNPVPTLYVRTLSSFMGPEYSIKLIFGKAREFAPCYLVFEDLDSIVSDSVRSYFLNEVDGLTSNDGIFMVGSTNHLDRLDPGIAKRPSRFDRKYLFSDPDRKERVMYAQFWQGKLKDNKQIVFPDELCGKMADITDGFSFAYMQEAFVAALLSIARGSQADDPDIWTEVQRSDASPGAHEAHPDATTLPGDVTEGVRRMIQTGFGMNPRPYKDSPKLSCDFDWVSVEGEMETVNSGDDSGLDDLVLWVQFQKQVAILREGMEDGDKGKA